MDEASQYLNSIYFNLDNPASYSGPDKLFRRVRREGKLKIGRKKITQWLQDQEPYSLQRPVRYKFRRRRVIVSGVDAQWDMDLADVTNISKYNDDINYLLFIIDIFSRYLWVVPLINKTAKIVASGLTDVLDGDRKPWTIRSDKGKEFTNEKVKDLLAKHGVKQFQTQNETKANYAERVIRTIKDIMYRYFVKRKTYRYIDVLSDIVANYNNRPHRSIGQMHPADVNAKNEAELWKKQYLNQSNHKEMNRTVSDIKIGDHVRITHTKKTFQRSYDQKWTRELFVVADKTLQAGVLIYKLKDFDGEDLSGSFYPLELQRVNTRNAAVWEIEKTIKRRGKGKKREILVKWLGWPEKFNSWIRQSEVKDAS